MPSVQVDANNIVVAAMSYDAQTASQVNVAYYDAGLIGKRYENGQFVDVVDSAGVGGDDVQNP